MAPLVPQIMGVKENLMTGIMEVETTRLATESMSEFVNAKSVLLART
jgi:hypothetical protein